MEEFSLNEIFEELVKRVIQDPQYIADRKAADLEPDGICLFIHPDYNRWERDKFTVILHATGSNYAECTLRR